MLVGSATKAPNDYGVDPVVSYPDEDGYRTSNVDYISGKSGKYKRSGDSAVEAARRALNKEGGRFDQVADVNAPLTAALMNYASGDNTARIVFRLLKHDGGHYARLVVSTNAELVSVIHEDKKAFSIMKKCHTVMAIPLSGRIEITSSNSAGTGMRGRTVHSYSMEQELEQFKAVGDSGTSLFSIPLYDPKALKVILDKKLPVAQLLLNITMKNGHAHLNAIIFKVHAQPDAHALLFTPRLSPVDDPAFDPSASKPQTRVRVEDSVYQVINSRVAALAQKACCSCSGGVCSCTNKGRYSWTLSHGQEVLSSRYGTERWEVGHIGEVLLALAIIRKACEENPDLTPEACLKEEGLVYDLLKRSGHHRLAESLNGIYKEHGVPSLLSLLTHTSGLPHEGCVDAECSPQSLDRLLPCTPECSSIDSSDTEGVLAHVVGHRIVLNSRPDCKVRHSILGMSILGHCDADSGGLIKGICRELSMVGSTLKKAVFGPDCHPGDHLHRMSHLFESSTNDLCQIPIAAERSRTEPSAHRLVRLLLTPKYLIKDLGHHGLVSMTYGGFESITVRVKQADGKKRSHVVVYKVGERGLKSSSVLIYVPGMHIGFACAFDAPVSRLFNCHSHKTMGYGKNSDSKIYKFKNLVKSILVDLPVGMVNTAAELAFSVTPRYPPHSSAYKADCDALKPCPGPEHSSWDSLLTTSPLFTGAGVAFYPFVLAMSLFSEAVDGAAHTTEKILDTLLPIRVYRENNRFYVYDGTLKKALPMVFDPAVTARVGVSCASKHSMQCGAFRVMSHVLPDEIAGVLSIHPYQDSPKDSICIYYRGCAFVSETEIKKVFSTVKTERSELIDASITDSKNKKDMSLRPWMVASKAADQKAKKEEEQIGISVGGAIAAGALGGFAGAALARGVYGPRRYYYGPYGYPYRPYATVYPPPPPYYY